MSKVTTFNKAGAVRTGFSLPYVAKYVSDGQGGITYTDGMRLARGVSQSTSPTVQEASYFSADNGAAESDASRVSSGSVTLTVDGLLPAAYKFITGLPDRANGEKFDKIGDSAYNNRPDVGLGWIVRFMCGGVTLYAAFALARAKYADSEDTVNTQEYNSPTNWQTSPLTFNFQTAEDANHTWKYNGDYYTTEAEAEADLQELFGITA